jgi:hypothetical protein
MTKMIDVYMECSVETLLRTHEEISDLRRENNLMRDMIIQLVTAYDKKAAGYVISGLDAEIEALRSQMRARPSSTAP